MQALHQCDLSIIIPVFNLENYITPMLLALLSQECSYSVEYIFVLNNCTDHSRDVILESGLDCKIINCSIQGCGPARNAGLEIAGGEFIWFMDGDDWLLSETALEDVLTKAKFEGLNILRIPFAHDRYHFEYFSMVWQYLFRREFIEEFRFPAIQPAEDDVYMTQVLAKAGYNRGTYMSMPHMDAPLYFYNYMREGSNMFRVAAGERI